MTGKVKHLDHIKAYMEKMMREMPADLGRQYGARSRAFYAAQGCTQNEVREIMAAANAQWKKTHGHKKV